MNFPRVVSRFGNDREPYREKSAKMLAVLLHGMKGTPYIYQGEEIGMTNVSGLRIEDYQDIESVNFAEDRKKKAGRKKKFVPILHGTAGTMRGRQCSGMRKNTPDLQREHRGWRKIRITRRSMWKTAEKSPDSLFYFYQKLIALRRKNDTLVYGDFRLIEEENSGYFCL